MTIRELTIELRALLMDVEHIRKRCHDLYREMRITQNLEEIKHDIIS